MKLLRRDLAYLLTDYRLTLIEEFGHTLVGVLTFITLVVIMLGGLPNG